MVTDWVASDPEMYSCAVKSLGVGGLAIGGLDEEPFLLPPSFRGTDHPRGFWPSG